MSFWTDFAYEFREMRKRERNLRKRRRYSFIVWVFSMNHVDSEKEYMILESFYAFDDALPC